MVPAWEFKPWDICRLLNTYDLHCHTIIIVIVVVVVVIVPFSVINSDPTTRTLGPIIFHHLHLNWTDPCSPWWFLYSCVGFEPSVPRFCLKHWHYGVSKGFKWFIYVPATLKSPHVRELLCKSFVGAICCLSGKLHQPAVKLDTF